MVNVTFKFVETETDEEYTVKAFIFLGSKAPAQNWDRFQEPDEPDEVEIDDIFDSAGKLVNIDTFSDSVIEDMKDKALEVYSDNGPDSPDFV